MFLPIYRGWVIVASLAVCFATWFVIERTRLGAYLRAATENPALVQAFGINVPRMVTLTYGAGVGLAALAGVLAAPIYQVSPLMGSNIIIVVFAVVVIGGMGSILGAIVSGFALGRHRGADQGVLSRGVEHGHLRRSWRSCCWSSRPGCLAALVRCSGLQPSPETRLSCSGRAGLIGAGAGRAVLCSIRCS